MLPLGGHCTTTKSVTNKPVAIHFEVRMELR